MCFIATQPVIADRFVNLPKIVVFQIAWNGIIIQPLNNTT
jgi:hypothetical protein